MPVHSPAVGLKLNYCLRGSHHHLAFEVMQQNTDGGERKKACVYPLKDSNGPFSKSR